MKCCCCCDPFHLFTWRKSLALIFSYPGCELWFFALLSLLSSLTMKNSVCSRDGGGADTANDTGKEGKNSQLSSIREKKNESDWIQRENTLDWVGWTGGCGGIKYPSNQKARIENISSSVLWELEGGWRGWRKVMDSDLNTEKWNWKCPH